MSRMTKAMGWILAGLCVVAAGCTTVQGIKPMQPKYGEVVSDLQPMLTWAPSKEAGVTYDLMIYESAQKEISTAMTGQGQYFREGLSGTSHKVEVPLKPSTEYKWAIRTRKGSQVGEWNMQEKTLFLVLFFHHETRHFTFKTP